MLKAQIVDTLICDVQDRDTTQFEHLPWFGNNAYLETFLDSIGYPSAGGVSRIVGPDRVKFHVPIKFWIYRNSAGIGGPTFLQLRNYMDNLNKTFNVDNQTLIGFYMRCEIGYIDDDSHVNVESDTEAWSLLQNHKDRGCINIHIANTISDNANGIQYRARFFGVDGIFLSRQTSSDELATVFPHEVGHYFELDHTHQYYDKGKCRKEAIDRNRYWPTFSLCFGSLHSNRICEATGDGLEDTPADPELNSNASCTYNAAGNYNGRTDLWNDFYQTPPIGSSVPSTRNIMSYNRDRQCRVAFSRMQIAVLLYSLYRGKNTNNFAAWQDSKGEYDDFEMDNFQEAARVIALDENQEHNFNQQYYGDGVWGQCDVDWVTFTAPCNSNIQVFTSAMTGRTNANTRLTLFSNTLVQLAQNDNISGTNLYSRLVWNFVAGQQYFIRVENMGQNVTGYYNLGVGNPFPDNLSIGGNSILCSSGAYSINNLPAGFTVTWSAAPTSVVSISCTTCTQPTLTKVSDGLATLTAVVSFTNNCGTIVSRTFTKQVYVGLAQLSITHQSGGVPASLMIYNGTASTYNQICMYAISNIYATSPNATSITWTKVTSSASNISWTPSGNNLSFYLWAANQTAVFRVTATNACGSKSVDFGFKAINCGGCKMYVISPNPANSGELNVVVPNIPPPCKSANTTTIEKNNLGSITEIKLYDNLGNLKIEHKYAASSKQVHLNTSALKPGIYFIEIFDGEQKERQQVVIAQ